MKRRESKPSSPSDSITITLGHLASCGMSDTPGVVPPLTILSQTRGLDGKTSYRVARIIRDVSLELETYNKVRIELLEKFGTLNEDKTRYIFPTPEAATSFETAHNEVLSTPITLHHSRMPELLDVVQLTPAEILTLEWLLTP